MVEFAILAPLAFFIVFGAIDFGRAAFDNNVTANAAREAARAVIPAQEATKSLSAKQADMIAAVRRTLGGGIVLDGSQVYSGATCASTPASGLAKVFMSFTADASGNISGQTPVTVTVCYHFQPWVPLVSRYLNIVLSSTTTMTTEY